MMRLFSMLLVGMSVVFCAGAAEVTGIVYHDENENGQWDEGEPGIPGVAVSNGEDVVLTDVEGRYALAMGEKGIVFVNKPKGWMPPLDPVSNTMQFHYLHRPDGSPTLKYGGIPPTGPLPESVDFPLYPHEEPTPVRMLALGDSQPRDFTEVHYFAQDMVAELAGTDEAFGFTLGDIVFDGLEVFEPLKQATGQIGIPWHYVPGNHDMDFDAPTWEQAFETFQHTFGPAYYAFAHANLHVFILNNIRLHVGERNYHAELGEKQRAFVRNYLEHVAEDDFILYLMHIPMMGLEDKEAFFEIIAPYPNSLSMSSHWHRLQHFFLGPEDGWPGEIPQHHIVQGTAGGAWYRGHFDAVSIPEAVQADGTPKGYSIVTVDGAAYDVAFRATRRPASYQMDIHAPARIEGASEEGHEVIANFFNGTERCALSMRLNDGPWIEMEQFEGQAPFYLELFQRQNDFAQLMAMAYGIEEVDDSFARLVENKFRPVIGRGMPTPRDTNHLWRADLPGVLEPGYNLVEVRAKDMFGSTHTARRYIYMAE